MFEHDLKYVAPQFKMLAIITKTECYMWEKNLGVILYKMLILL